MDLLMLVGGTSYFVIDWRVVGLDGLNGADCLPA